MQAFIKELMKEDEARFLHLYDFFKTPAEMAQALRKLASKLPAAVGIDLRSLQMVSKFSWVSQFLTLLWGLTTRVDKDALAAASTVYVEVRELLSKNEDNNLTCAINGYEKVLLEASPVKKPVFIFGTSSLCFFLSRSCYLFSVYSFCHPCFSFHIIIILVLQCRCD